MSIVPTTARAYILTLTGRLGCIRPPFDAIFRACQAPVLPSHPRPCPRARQSDLPGLGPAEGLGSGGKELSMAFSDCATFSIHGDLTDEFLESLAALLIEAAEADEAALDEDGSTADLAV